MQAIILAGGFGTRLKSAIGEEIPKPMAPISGEPFLAHFLRYLKAQGIYEVVLSLHHLGYVIRDYFGATFEGMPLFYTQEKAPLGTGGALRYAMAEFPCQHPLFVANGDSFAAINLSAMRDAHITAKTSLTIGLREMRDCRRYGEALIDTHQCVTAFQYPGRPQPGWISTGNYIINPDLFQHHSLPDHFSFEADFQQPFVTELKPLAWKKCSYFIDIGMPDDYARAQEELVQHMNKTPQAAT